MPQFIRGLAVAGTARERVHGVGITHTSQAACGPGDILVSQPRFQIEIGIEAGSGHLDDGQDSRGWAVGFDVAVGQEQCVHPFGMGNQKQLCYPALVLLCASFNFCAHSSQQTSTVFPPSFTLIALSSSLQSQAAQVFSVFTLLILRYPR
jgi:hypothetical protein